MKAVSFADNDKKPLILNEAVEHVRSLLTSDAWEGRQGGFLAAKVRYKSTQQRLKRKQRDSDQVLMLS